MIDRDLLVKIRGWYEDQLHILKGEIHEGKTRRYLHQRIETINLLLLQMEEENYLRSLDALFLLDDSITDPITDEMYGDTDCTDNIRHLRD